MVDTVISTVLTDEHNQAAEKAWLKADGGIREAIRATFAAGYEAAINERATAPSTAAGEKTSAVKQMERSPERWANMSPDVVADGSRAQVVYALKDAQHDIALLVAALATPTAPSVPWEEQAARWHDKKADWNKQFAAERKGTSLADTALNVANRHRCYATQLRTQLRALLSKPAKVGEEKRTYDDGRDEAATFIFTELFEALGLEGFTIQDGSETWEGDVRATLMGILRDANVIDEETNERVTPPAQESNPFRAAMHDAYVASEGGVTWHEDDPKQTLGEIVAWTMNFIDAATPEPSASFRDRLEELARDWSNRKYNYPSDRASDEEYARNEGKEDAYQDAAIDLCRLLKEPETSPPWQEQAAQIRRDALEEAARICRDEAMMCRRDMRMVAALSAETCAYLIRALLSKPAKGEG